MPHGFTVTIWKTQRTTQELTTAPLQAQEFMNRKDPLSQSHFKGTVKKTHSKDPDDNEYANVISIGQLCYL